MTEKPSEAGLLPRWLYTICLALIIFGIGARMTVIGLSHYLNQSAENAAISGILDVSEGKPLYPDKTATPFRLYTYTPLQALVVGKILSPLKHFSTLTRVYWIRFSSFLFLITLLVLYWKYYIRNYGVTGQMFLLSLALGFSEFGNYALSGRNDFLALLMEVSAGACFVRWIDRKKLNALVGYSLFCAFALLTRQNSAGMLLSGCLYLLIHRQFKELFSVASMFSFFIGISFSAIHLFYPHFWMHSFKAHVGVWRPFYWLHPNTLQFFVCYSLFIFLGVKNCLRKDSLPQLQFIKIVTIVSSILAFILIHRHGAWLNYFFETLLMLVFFTARELTSFSSLPQKSQLRRTLIFLVPIMAVLIFGLTTYKAHKQMMSLAFLEFSEGAEAVKADAPQGGVSLGAWAQGLGVYLRDWEVIGPEILNGSHYGEANFKNFQWVYEQLNRKINSGTPPVLLYVNPSCGETQEASSLISDPYLMAIMGNYRLKKRIYPWLCLYGHPSFN